MNAARIASLVAMLVVMATVDLSAQQEMPVEPGDRVRVSAPGVLAGQVVGTIKELSPDTCVLQVEGRPWPVALPLASVTQLEVSRGHKSKSGIGILIGGGVGFLGGYLIGTQTTVCETCGGSESKGKTGLAFGTILGLLGAAAGGELGSRNKVELWEEVPIERLRLSIRIYRASGLGIAASLNF
jgi:hypothetical protein